jgi:hypothetical protein
VASRPVHPAPRALAGAANVYVWLDDPYFVRRRDIPTPEFVADFLVAFDLGKYPELIELIA